MPTCQCQICGGAAYPASAEITGRPLCAQHYQALNMQLTHASLKALRKVKVYKCAPAKDTKRVLISARGKQIRAYHLSS